MEILKYLEKNEIAWLPLNIKTTDGGKVPHLPTGYSNDWIHFRNNPSKAQLLEIQTHYASCNAIAIDTRKIGQVDIDDLSAPGVQSGVDELMKDKPYFRSYSKRLPHFFCKIKSSSKNCTKIPGGDLLAGQWSYCRKDAIVQNAECELLSYAGEPEVKPKLSLTDPHEIQTLIQKYVPNHSKTQVKSITENGSITTNGRFCAKIDQAHRSNHVWFVIRDSKLYQKCCDPECAGFESVGYPFGEAPDAADDGIIIKDDNEGAEYFIQQNSSILKKCGTRFFIFNDNKWTEENIEMVMADKLLSSKICKSVQGKTISYAGNVSGTRALYYAVKAKLPNDPEFVDRLWNASLKKSFWKNGYWDFNTQKFVESVLPEDSETTIRIPFDFPTRNEENMNKVRDELLGTIFKNTPDLAQNYLEQCARALAGHVEDKDWVVCLGERNSGKGTLQSIHEACWKPYVLTLDGNILLMERGGGGGGDQAKKNSAFIDAEYKRFIFTQEILCDATSNAKLNGGLIKGKLASGGDTISARKNYKDEINFKIQARPFINLNDMPPVSPADALQTCSVFQMRSVFSSSASNDSWVQKANPEIKSQCNTPEWISGFTWLVLEAYRAHAVVKCDTVKDDTDKFLIDGGEEWSVIKDYFSITGLKTDVLYSTEVNMWLKRIQINMSPQKLKSRLELMGAKYSNHLPNGRGWRGIKITKDVPTDY